MAAKQKCHWRVVTSETDFYGGPTRADAVRLQAQILKRKGERGRIDKHCESLGGLRSAKLRCPSARGIDKRQLARGTRVELEHTEDRAAARCIALAHLHESPDYYVALAKMEKGLRS